MSQTEHKRFTVIVYGDFAFNGASYDGVYSQILAHHRARQKACGFRVDFSVTYYDPSDEIPYSSGYAVIDNHVEEASLAPLDDATRNSVGNEGKNHAVS